MRCARNGAGVSRQAALDCFDRPGKTLGRRQRPGVSARTKQFAFARPPASRPSRQNFPTRAGMFMSRSIWIWARQAASLAYGAPVEPFYKLDQAQVIVSLDCDFIGSEENAYANIRRFAKGRAFERQRRFDEPALRGREPVHLDRPERGPSSARAAEHDCCRAGPPGAEYSRLVGHRCKVAANWPRRRRRTTLGLSPCAKDLKANAGKSLVMAGYRLPLAAHLLVIAINEALGRGQSYRRISSSAGAPRKARSPIWPPRSTRGQVQTLVILGGNPAYNAPADLNWPQAQAKAKTVVRLGYYEDETSWNPTRTPRRNGICRWRIFWNPGAMPARPTARWCRFSH